MPRNSPRSRPHCGQFFPLLTLTCLLFACQGTEPTDTASVPQAASGVSTRAITTADDHPDGWLTTARTYDEQRYSPLARIDDQNVEDLGLAWTYETGRRRGHEATPLLYDGVLYVTTPWSEIHAVDARTGEGLWSHDPEVPGPWGRYACCDVVNRGVALWGEYVYSGTLDGRLLKLDRETGEVVWDIDTIDRNRPYTITGAPRILPGDDGRGKVIIGNGGAEYGVRGYITAYDTDSGEQLWRFFTVPGDPSLPFEHPELEAAARTWNGEWWEIGGGGTVWDSMAYDPELDLLYIGTGNGTPWSRTHRSPGGGDNLYLSSILALRADDGSLVWHYQTTPGDNWDYTATQHIILADLEIDGEPRKVAMQAPKNGFFFVLDRVTGELLSAEKFAHVTWATHVDPTTGRPVESEIADYDEAAQIIVPGPGGAHNWQPMSFSPQTGLVYIPARDGGAVYGLEKDFDYTPGVWNTGIGLTDDELTLWAELPPGVAYLRAWNPVTQEEAWSRVQPSGSSGGLLSTAGNLVFQGTSDGLFTAYAADSGEVLWQAATETGIGAAPMTYELDGEQYVTVLAGYGGGDGAIARTHENRGRLYTFKLGAAEPFPEIALKSANSQPPEPFGTPGQITHGKELYTERCASCHGREVVSRGMISDLRFSRKAVHENYAEILLGGRFESRGMAAFDDVLSEEDVHDIHAYVVQQAHAAETAQE